ncbi:glycoside hydrolase family 127 protein [Agriterribacter sp.]|uniref:glycoside hydrolase family 127 protein n=1 Tax=Agriterribacter sp. TaxID=2821509 RepID=UPI002BCF6E67|nr:beta-L-arabinofuranosidase domain-containing protein [Agriterribacter sp.]HTN08586.1 beta-L-arabinofuranosidase domain-containing protein [Agriterribacter sp.]
MKKTLLMISVIFSVATAASQTSLQKLYPVSFSDVTITDPFWKPKMGTVATATLDACVNYTQDKTGRIRNFEKAAKHSGKHEGIYYDDSDVYKAIEAIAYSLKNYPNPTLEKHTDEWIEKIAAAQLPDGYLNTYYILTDINKRWTDMEKHEDYCAGHLIEAGIAYYNTTGKNKLLHTAIRFADHIDSVFRQQNRPWVSGHQEIELALMKLYHHTQNKKYLELANWFLDQRGRGNGKGVIWDQWKDPAYCQDGLPVKDQRKITGHAVRAMYLYTGAADVAAVTNDAGYITAMDSIWQDVVFHHMYITGGIGAQGSNEGFGKPYDLPNATAYCETCASVGMVFWNQRMNMLSGDAKYIDILERSLYNGALDGLSLSGDRFFYGNPLAASGNHNRSEWFGTACCPSNIARLVSSLGNYIYGTSKNAVWVNIFAGSHAMVQLNKNKVNLSMETGYPWKGNIKLAVSPAKMQQFELRIRIPGWLSTPAPGNLYHYETPEKDVPEIKVNGTPAQYTVDEGYAVIKRVWKKDDIVTMELPMKVRRIISNPAVKQNENRVALQYGPLVYCVEGTPNDEFDAGSVIVPAETNFEISYDASLLGGVNVLRFNAPVVTIHKDGLSVSTINKKITAIPYYSWNNRGANDMQVWLPSAIQQISINE